MNDKQEFTMLTEKLVDGLLREAIGYRVEYHIPYYQGIVGYMVEAPMLWIRHSRFPILFIAYDQRRPVALTDIVKQVEMAKATEFFAILIVVPVREDAGNEAEELRHIVRDSVYRYDFVVLDRQHLASIIAQNSSQRFIEIILSQGIELSALSPYVFKGPVSEKMFFGREKEVKTISQTIQRGDYAVVGGRRIGKSSTLLKIIRLLNNDPRYRAIYTNCEEKFDYEDLFQAFSEEFNQPLDIRDPLSFRRLVSAVKKDGSPRQIVFLMDEIDELLAYDAASRPAGQLFKTFRALSHEGVCRFVFSGSRALYKHLHNPQSPFFNFCEDLALKPLERKSVAEIVSKPMKQLGIELTEEEAMIERIVEVTSCHPNIVQWLCDRLLKATPVCFITPDDLEMVIADAEFHNHFIQTAWGEATPLERLISLLMEGPTFGYEEISNRLARYGIINRMMIQQSLEMLQVYSLLERQGQMFRFGLTHFPRIARAVEDVESQIEALLTQVEA
jgi:hypothetical protein